MGVMTVPTMVLFVAGRPVRRAVGFQPLRVLKAKVLDQLRPGDTLAVWKMDRLGRSLRHLIDTVGELERRGVGFRSLQESIDTSTPAGKLIFHIFGALAEFERDLIRERTAAGLAAARARGRAGGRPPVMTPEKLKVARQMYGSREHTIETIAKTVSTGKTNQMPGAGGHNARRPQKRGDVARLPCCRIRRPNA